MRTASVFLLILATHAAVLFVAPTEAVRILSEATSSTTPAEPAGAYPSPNSTDVSLVFEVTIEGGTCAPARGRVRNAINNMMKRVTAPIKKSVKDIKLSTRCSTSQGSATIIITIDIDMKAGSVDLLIDIIDDWDSRLVDVNAWTETFREMKSLVKWADNKSWKITGIDTVVDCYYCVGP